MHVLIGTRLKLKENPLQIEFLSVPLLWYSVLQTLAAVVSSDTWLYHLSSGRLLDSAWILLPVLQLGNSVKAVIWGNHRAHIVSNLSCISVFHCLMSQCLDSCHFIYFVLYFVHFR